MRVACFWSLVVQNKPYNQRWLSLETLEELDACMAVVEDNLARRVTVFVTHASFSFHHPIGERVFVQSERNG